MATEKRLIWGDIAESQLKKLADHYHGSFSGDAFERAMQLIAELPTVDAVEVVHGRWIWHNKRALFEFKYECSICHDGSDLESNYCPNCGAKMDGERKDNA